MNEPPLLHQALRLARRELRNGLRGFGVFLACLFLGVFAISGIGSFTAAAKSGLLADASGLLGGDLEIHRMYQPLSEAQQHFLDARGLRSDVIEMRSMAGNPHTKEHVLVELKAVDNHYPLYGRLEIEPLQPTSQALARQGALVEAALLERLHLKVGDALQLGDARLQIRGIIKNEPDRAIRAFYLGPRLLISRATLDTTGLIRPGSLVTYLTRLKLADPNRAEQVVAELQQTYPEAGWRLQTWRKAAPRVRHLLDRMDTNLSLLGLCALLLGGLGVAGAVRGYLNAKVMHIATLKCLGASSRVIFTTYLLQILFLGGIGAGAGLAAGATLPWLIGLLWGSQLPIPLQPALFPLVLLRAALFGLLIALLFSLKELGIARRVPPAVLFRGYAPGGRTSPGRAIWLSITVIGLLLAALAFFSSEDQRIAGGFILGGGICFIIFRLLAMGVIRLARRLPSPTQPALRLGLANIHRRGSPATSVLFSLGLGLTALVMIALVQANLGDMVNDSLPEEAPAFFFLDIQPDQVAAFDQRLASMPLVTKVERYPTLRGRITAIKGIPVEQAKIASNVQWAVRGDRFLSYADKLPAGSRLDAGKWWPPGYKGAPKISLSADLAKGFHVQIGDSLTVNVLGRSITAEISSLRTIDWSSLELNFAILFSPGVLEGAPQTHLAAVHVAPAGENELFRAITGQFPNVSAISTRELLRNVSRTLARIGSAFNGMAAITLLNGFLVLAGAISADQHRRIHDAVIFKVCGATRGDILLAFAAEFAILGLAAGAISALVGSLAALAILKGPMDVPFHLHPLVSIATLLTGITLTLLLGLAGTWKALGQKPAIYLRDE
ncbi:ABC transporter permease [Geopsychrobacter electrodiphilus]|uniref:ABC transporter permease n=1 Tax=Geopsychrobacter electrodiphilus TaxID=225196 RepID=UPI000360B88E|nr:FtsX-like permease family protein [Geopsychrobacter electrodiphilus]